MVALVAAAATGCGSSTKTKTQSSTTSCTPAKANLSLISGGPSPTLPSLGQVTTEFGSVTAKGKALPSYPETPSDCYVDPAVGEQAPVLTGQRFDGSPITIAASGKPTVVFFVAHWCPHCNREVPALVSEWTKQGLPKGVQLFSVTTGSAQNAPNWPPSQWLTDLKWPVANLADDAKQTAAASFGLPGYPFIVMLKPDGTVYYRHSGEWPVSDFDDEVARLVAASG
jgi:thiol-disulfide isomerase/thioredoxin